MKWRGVHMLWIKEEEDKIENNNIDVIVVVIVAVILRHPDMSSVVDWALNIE